jgi:septum site-determining protein MinC
VNSVTPIDKTGATPVQRKTIRFPARSFLAFALAPEEPLAEWFESLDSWTANSPGFFAGRPVVLDLSYFKPEREAVARLVAMFADRGIRIYAIEAAGVDTLGPDLPPVLKGAKSTVIDTPAGGRDIARPAPLPASTTLILDQPVRSGQSIYHPDGDVVVLGSVASGSEVVAGGSIHIYGALRGRAFAGASGNSEARIFCRRHEAELMVIDGWYRTADDMESSTRGKPVQAFLEDGFVWVAVLK